MSSSTTTSSSSNSTFSSSYTSFSSLLIKNEELVAQIEVFLATDSIDPITEVTSTTTQSSLTSSTPPKSILSNIVQSFSTLFKNSNSSNSLHSLNSSNSSKSSLNSSTVLTTTTNSSVYQLRTQEWIGAQFEEIKVFGTFSENNVNIIKNNSSVQISQSNNSITTPFQSTTSSLLSLEDLITPSESGYTSSTSTTSNNSISTPLKLATKISKTSSYSNLSGPLPSSRIQSNSPRKSSTIITQRALFTSPFPAPLPIHTPTLLDNFIPASISPTRRSMKVAALKHEKARNDWAEGTTSLNASNLQKFWQVKEASGKTYSVVVGKVGEVNQEVIQGLMIRSNSRGGVSKKLRLFNGK